MYEVAVRESKNAEGFVVYVSPYLFTITVISCKITLLTLSHVSDIADVHV